MLAKDVDKLGYGDCKVLMNYTRVLLKSICIDAYYTIYGDQSIRNIDQKFCFHARKSCNLDSAR
jgi:hypothetical protein